MTTTLTITLLSWIKQFLSQWDGTSKHEQVRREVDEILKELDDLEAMVWEVGGPVPAFQLLPVDDQATLHHLQRKNPNDDDWGGFARKDEESMPPISIDELALSVALAEETMHSVSLTIGVNYLLSVSPEEEASPLHSYFDASCGVPLWREDMIRALVNVGGFTSEEACSAIQSMATSDHAAIATAMNKFTAYVTAWGTDDSEAEACFDRLVIYAPTSKCRAIASAKAAVVYAKAWLVVNNIATDVRSAANRAGN